MTKRFIKIKGTNREWGYIDGNTITKIWCHDFAFRCTVAITTIHNYSYTTEFNNRDEANTYMQKIIKEIEGSVQSVQIVDIAPNPSLEG